MERIQSFRLHAGVHKTATTHLQYVLASHRDELAREGVDYLPMEDIRRIGIVHRNIRSGNYIQRQIEKLASFERWIRPLRLGPPNIVISEENLVGILDDVFQTRLYHHATERLRKATSRMETKNISLFLSIRSYDEFIPSAYAQLLKRHAVKGGFEQVRHCADRSTWGYVDLVKRIHEAHPWATFRVWCQEDYRNHQAQILSELCGGNFDFSRGISPPKKTLRPSAEAVRQMERIEMDEGEQRRLKMLSLIETHEGEGRYMPYRDSEREILKERYRQDMAEIRTRFPDVMMSFG